MLLPTNILTTSGLRVLSIRLLFYGEFEHTMAQTFAETAPGPEPEPSLDDYWSNNMARYIGEPSAQYISDIMHIFPDENDRRDIYVTAMLAYNVVNHPNQKLIHQASKFISSKEGNPVLHEALTETYRTAHEATMQSLGHNATAYYTSS